MSLDSFDPGLFMLGMVVSGIGFVLFVYGKKQQRWPQLVAGVLLSVFPYFVTSVPLMMVISAVIGVALWWVIRLGY